MLDSIKLLKDSNVSDSQIFITLKSKFSGKHLQPIQECVRALKAKQSERVNTVSAKVDDMTKQMNITPLHHQVIQELKKNPDMLDNEIAFVNFYSYYLQQLKLSKDEATAETFLIAETFLSNNISNEYFSNKRDIANVLHYATNDNVNVQPIVVNDIEKIEDGEPPSKYQRSDDSNVSVHDDLDLLRWLTNIF